LRGEEESCVLVAKGLGTWPEIAGSRKRQGKEQQCPKINLKF